jgi:hypothetical protein
MRWAARALILAVAGFRAFAADDGDLLSRIREHMREYVARLPDYTCRVTIERSARRSARAAFEITDRLRLEIAYSSGREYYAWPGDDRFENGIEELLPQRGLVSEGSYALHTRKLFLTNDAQFGAPRSSTDCGGSACTQVDFLVPAVRSGFAIAAGGAAAPAALRGSVWFERQSLDPVRMEVRVEDTPRSVRIAGTREVTTYARTRIGEVEFVLPATSELTLRDRDGSERLNLSRFDECHRFAGSSTVRYGAGDSADVPVAAPVREARVPAGTKVVGTLDAPIPGDVAVGDQFTASGSVTGQITGQITGRITDLRRAGERWSVELSLLRVGPARARGSVRRTVMLPVPAGATFTWRTE